MEDNTVYINDVKFQGESEFAKSMNVLHDLLQDYYNAKTEEEKKEKWSIYFQRKMAMEMGY